MYHLWDVSTHEKVNRMSPNNLAIVFGPTIMRPQVQDLQEMLSNSTKVDLCTYMILEREALFPLDKLKPMTEKTLGPMPDLGLKRDKERKERKESVTEKETAQSKVMSQNKGSVRATGRKMRDQYSDALHVMQADLTPEV